MNSFDRTVHATIHESDALYEVVRYSRAGKWYIESLVMPRRSVTVEAAAQFAHAGPGVRIHLGLPGGGAFDRLVQR